MRKWWRFPKKGSKDPAPSEISPLPEPEVSLPDPQEAREALAKARRDNRRVKELAPEVYAMLETMRSAREDNHFAEAIVRMINEGR